MKKILAVAGGVIALSLAGCAAEETEATDEGTEETAEAPAEDAMETEPTAEAEATDGEELDPTGNPIGPAEE